MSIFFYFITSGLFIHVWMLTTSLRSSSDIEGLSISSVLKGRQSKKIQPNIVSNTISDTTFNSLKSTPSTLVQAKAYLAINNCSEGRKKRAYISDRSLFNLSQQTAIFNSGDFQTCLAAMSTFSIHNTNRFQ